MPPKWIETAGDLLIFIALLPTRTICLLSCNSKEATFFKSEAISYLRSGISPYTADLNTDGTLIWCSIVMSFFVPCRITAVFWTASWDGTAPLASGRESRGPRATRTPTTPMQRSTARLSSEMENSRLLLQFSVSVLRPCILQTNR